MMATTVDDVLAQLDDIIEQAKITSSRLGFFPAVYRLVTSRVKQGIDADFFDDGPRMDVFTTQFANQYLLAVAAYQNNRPLSRAWRVAFDVLNRPNTVIIQHIILGMNAHINLDLAVVTAEVGDRSSIKSLEADFNRINDILETAFNEVQERINQLSPLLDVLDKVGDTVDESIINFNIKKARQKAWEKALFLAALPTTLRQPAMHLLDTEVAFLGRLVAQPGGILGKAVEVSAWAEEDNVLTIIDTLAS